MCGRYFLITKQLQYESPLLNHTDYLYLCFFLLVIHGHDLVLQVSDLVTSDTGSARVNIRNSPAKLGSWSGFRTTSADTYANERVGRI
jgi:hypothetical protein